MTSSALLTKVSGKGFAAELASRGFEVILHGRNEKKLEGVKTELESQFPGRKFRLFILDAEEDSASSGKMAERLSEFKKLNIRILVNNIAGGGKYEMPIFAALQDRTTENVNGWINISSRFPSQLTRLLLPTLTAKPSSLVLNIGSGASELGCPYIVAYCGCKAYNKAFSMALRSEMKATGNEHVEVIAITVGTVATEKMQRKVTWDTPSPRQMARSSLAATGCGRPVIWAYWGHAVGGAITSMIPESVVEKMARNLTGSMKANEEAGKPW